MYFAPVLAASFEGFATLLAASLAIVLAVNFATIAGFATVLQVLAENKQNINMLIET